MKVCTLVLFLAVSAAGCHSAGARDADGFGKSETGLLVGKFRAINFGNHVVLYASGFHGTTGVSSGLAREADADGIPQFRLYGQWRQGQAVGAAMTPFLVSRVVPPADYKTVRVRDARGTHDVPIEPAEVIAYDEWERLAYPKAEKPPN